MIPLAAVFQCDRGWPRWVMAGYTSLLALLLALGLLVADADAAGGMFVLAFFGSVLGSWIGYGLSNVRTRGRAAG